MSSQGPNIGNTSDQTRNESSSESDDDGRGGTDGGVAAAVVIIILFLIGAGMVVAGVLLVLYLRRRDKSLTSCLKGRGNRLFAIGEWPTASIVCVQHHSVLNSLIASRCTW